MKRNSLFLSSIIILIVLLGCGNDYSNEVKIGNQVWMIENLNVSRFRNGDPIPEAKTKDEWIQAGIKKRAVWCYYDNDSKNRTKHGKLYNWYAVNDPRGLAPTGWNVPTNDDWNILVDFLGGKGEAEEKMKCKDVSKETSKSHFLGLPGGIRSGFGEFYDIGNCGYWWTSSVENNYNAAYHTIKYGVIEPQTIIGGNLDCGMSVRCLKE